MAVGRLGRQTSSSADTLAWTARRGWTKTDRADEPKKTFSKRENAKLDRTKRVETVRESPPLIAPTSSTRLRSLGGRNQGLRVLAVLAVLA